MGRRPCRARRKGMPVRKRSFRLSTVTVQEMQRVVVLTYNLQDIQPWKQKTPCYQSAIYRADASGLPTGAALQAPAEYASEEAARRGHAAIVSSLRHQSSATAA